jgi:hypothetical protein
MADGDSAAAGLSILLIPLSLSARFDVYGFIPIHQGGIAGSAKMYRKLHFSIVTSHLSAILRQIVEKRLRASKQYAQRIELSSRSEN